MWNFKKESGGLKIFHQNPKVEYFEKTNYAFGPKDSVRQVMNQNDNVKPSLHQKQVPPAEKRETSSEERRRKMLNPAGKK